MVLVLILLTRLSIVDLCTRAAELLDAIPETSTKPAGEQEPKMTRTKQGFMHPVLAPNVDEEEAELEAQELNKYLLAKSFFDCREYDRCAAVFLPDSLLSGVLSLGRDDSVISPQTKGKSAALPGSFRSSKSALPKLSQRSLFLALYAKLMSGEKRKDEDSEMVMGPHDLGTAVNKQLPVISRYLKLWFEDRSTPDDGLAMGSQGWLEYLSVYHSLQVSMLLT